MARVGERTRLMVEERARGRCEYCHAPQGMLGYRLHIEHIVPRARGGTNVFSNLASSCSPCNFAKGTAVESIDTASGARTPLLNPRLQTWDEHFAWADDGVTLQGRTAIGTVTIVALDINQPLQLSARRGWRQLGLLP